MNGKFWKRSLRVGSELYLSIVYNGTFSMDDGPVHVYVERDREIPITAISLRIGHLWLNVDVFR